MIYMPSPISYYPIREAFSKRGKKAYDFIDVIDTHDFKDAKTAEKKSKIWCALNGVLCAERVQITTRGFSNDYSYGSFIISLILYWEQ